MTANRIVHQKERQQQKGSALPKIQYSGPALEGRQPQGTAPEKAPGSSQSSALDDLEAAFAIFCLAAF